MAQGKKQQYSRRPRHESQPGDKSPRHVEKPETYDQLKVSWGISYLDWDGKWGWQSVDQAILINKIIPRLKSFESMRWCEIKADQKSNHSIEVGKIITEAQQRIRELGLSSLCDELFSLRMSGRGRVYGILTQGILKVIWYDPNHEICPSKKRNT